MVTRDASPSASERRDGGRGSSAAAAGAPGAAAADFSIARAFRFAAGAFRAHPLRLSALFLAMLLLWALLEVLVALGMHLLGAVTGLIVNVGLHCLYLWYTCVPEATLVQVSLDLQAGREPRFGETLRDLPLSVKYFGAKMLLTLLVLGGLALAVIPGIYFILRYQLVLYFVVARRCGPLTAFRLSSQATRGARGRLLAFDALLLVVNLLGACLLGLGLLVTIPLSALAGASAFRALDRGGRSA
jgi:hypothetical protein